MVRGGTSTRKSIAAGSGELEKLPHSRRCCCRRFLGWLGGATPCRPRSISEISVPLGFAHPNAVHEAFERWTCMTPAQDRDAATRRTAARRGRRGSKSGA
jgi:AraC-like DNA-binding protein